MLLVAFLVGVLPARAQKDISIDFSNEAVEPMSSVELANPYQSVNGPVSLKIISPETPPTVYGFASATATGTYLSLSAGSTIQFDLADYYGCAYMEITVRSGDLTLEASDGVLLPSNMADVYEWSGDDINGVTFTVTEDIEILNFSLRVQYSGPVDLSAIPMLEEDVSKFNFTLVDADMVSYFPAGFSIADSTLATAAVIMSFTGDGSPALMQTVTPTGPGEEIYLSGLNGNYEITLTPATDALKISQVAFETSNNANIEDDVTAGEGVMLGNKWTGSSSALTLSLKSTHPDIQQIIVMTEVAVVQAEDPVPSYDESLHQLTFTTATAGATIYYTTDGTDPTMDTGITYTGPITLTENTTVKAMAGGDGFTSSAIVEFNNTDFTCGEVQFSYYYPNLTMTVEPADATILYTLDLSDPTNSVFVETYTSPLLLQEDTTFMAYATRSNFNDGQAVTYHFSMADYTVATPQFSRLGDELIITTATQGATIYYTTDGENPTEQSAIYTTPIQLTGNVTVRAIAVKEGLAPSAIGSWQSDEFKVADVTFSYQNLQLTMSTTTEGATIYYTTDGTSPVSDDPTGAPTSLTYTSPIELTTDCVVRAYAVRENWTDADVTDYAFVMSDHTVATPQIVRNGDGVEISTATAGATIFYTTDGMVPDNTSTEYTAPIVLDGNVTVQAIATHTDYYPSEVAQLVADWFQVEDVVFNYANLQLSMSTTTEGATIYYTTDGSVPDNTSTIYTSPIQLNADCTVQAIAIRENWNASNVSSYVFNLTNVTADSPLFSRSGNSITIQAPTDGTTIYYTTDGTDPTTTSTAYTAPIEVTENMVIRAIAAGAGYNESPVAVYTVNWFKSAAVVFDFSNLQLTMSTTTENATVYYTTDGSIPTANSTPYTAPVALTEDCDVRAVAIRGNWNPSDITLFQFSRANYTAPTPLFSRNGDVLTLSTGNANVTVYYTLNGDVPTAASTPYTAAINLDANCIVRAIAVGNGYFDSDVSNYNVGWFKVSNVEFSYQDKVLQMTTPTPSATIYYTTDGTLPTLTSSVYTEPIPLTADCDVRAMAVREGWNNSGVSLYQFSLSNVTAPTPHFSRNGDVLTITTGSTDVKVYYTLDGSEPDTLSTLYTSAIQLTRNCIVRAIAAGAAYQVSPIATYTVDWFKVANVEFAYENLLLSMTTPTAESMIHYTMDGTVPTANSTTYTAPIQLTDDCDVQAIAVREGWASSEVSIYHFIVSTGSVALPQFARNGNVVTISTTTAGAKIYYTLDGSTPTATHGTPYTTPVELTQNGVLQAVAVLSNKQYSGIASYTVNWFYVENILFSFDGQWLTMTTSTENVDIHYSLTGGSAPVANATYTGPIEIVESCVVEAYGTKNNFHDSNMSRYEIDLDDLRTATPQLRAVGNTIEMTCVTAGAVIYYTLDGSTPNENSHLYTGPITLMQNCTVKAVAVCDGYRNSGFASLECTNFRVEIVSIEYVDGFLYLTTPTPNATIYYTLDGSTPTRNSASYNSPFELNAVTTVSAFAFKDDFNPSDVTSEVIDPSNVRCAVPTFTLSDRLLTISTLTDGATIRYTLDGTRPDGNSLLYTGPITLTENGTVWAEVTKSGYVSADAKFEVSCFYVELPSFTLADGRVVISSLTPDALIYYTTDGSEPTLSSERYSEPLSLPAGTHVRAVGMRRNFNNSLVSDYEVGVTSCASVDVAYNGHTFSLTTTTPGASIYYTLDGSNPSTSTYHYTAPTDVNQLVTIRAIAVKDGSNTSSVTVYEIPSIFNDEIATASVRTAGTLGKALEWKDGATLTSLTVLGHLNADDFSAITRISGLKHLYLQSAAVENEALPARAFAGSGMISVELPAFVSSVGESLFAGCPNLSAIVWRTQAELPSAALADFSNPNLLFFTSNASYAPAEVRNVVTGRRASRITLTDAAPNGNFFCVRQFYADRITYTHDYQQETGRGETVRGWETIALPFSVTRFIHETKGDITPFMADDSDKAHFWLYSIEATGPTAASELTANRPYLISMPNHDTYADRYILGGNVTFEGLNTNVPVTAPVAVSYNDHDVLPCFVRVKKTADIFVLNRGEQHGNHLEGSIFLSDYRDASPFEVYYTHAGTTGEVQGIGITGEIITGINDTMLLRSAAESCAEGLYDLSGRRVGRAGRVAQKGIYILDGKKVIIK